jgi:hypothetical protein
MYVAFAGYYYKRDDPNYPILQELMRESAEHLAAKVVHMFGDIWRMMFGVMPSGAYETSHGDSWIVTLIYFQYLIQCCSEYPELEKRIMECLELKVIALCVYGDDSIFGVPKDLTHVVNMYGFAKFVSDYHGMTMRDICEYDEFLASPNIETGGLIKKGISFLQRYFVKRETVTDREDLAPVLPYRCFYKIYTKYAFGTGEVRDPIDYVLAAIGMAYDSHGTNARAYEFASTMFKLNMTRLGTSFSEAINKYQFNESDTALTRLCRKLSIPLEQLRMGFPSRDSILDMHKPRYSYDRTMSGS